MGEQEEALFPICVNTVTMHPICPPTTLGHSTRNVYDDTGQASKGELCSP